MTSKTTRTAGDRSTGKVIPVARHAFLRAGFGFGNMRSFMVEDDITSGKIRAIRNRVAS